MKTGTGAVFLSADTKRLCLNLRASHKTHRHTWSLWGGMVEEGETPTQCLRREITEEMGFYPDIVKTYPFDVYESRDGSFRYYTFVCVVPAEFNPVVNREAEGYAWFNFGVWPKPLHDGIKSSLASHRGASLLEIILSQY